MLSYLLKSLRYWIKSRLLWILVPIKAGPLKGYRWSVVTGVRFLRGTYHESETATLIGLINPGDVVYDIGAHVGYYTLVAAQAAGDGRVIAFEPLELNRKTLRKHIEVNGIGNITVLPYAVSCTSGIEQFDLAGGTGRGQLSTGGKLAVEVKTIDELYSSGTIPPPNLIKMDIEGAEVSALKGAVRVIEACSPRIFLATHGAEIRRECEEFLRSHGYDLKNFRSSDIIATRPGARAPAGAKPERPAYGKA